MAATRSKRPRSSAASTPAITARKKAAGATSPLTQAARWEAMRARLAAFKAEHGHCRVHVKYPADPKLGGWVAHQRRSRKKLDAGLPNPYITAERVAKLQALGFEWRDGEMPDPFAKTGMTSGNFVFQLSPSLKGEEAALWRESRVAAVERWRQKKIYQRENPQVRYRSRKKIADKRPRVQGRFVKTLEQVTASRR